MTNLIGTPKMKIVSPYGRRFREGKWEDHKGVDLRSWNLVAFYRLPVIAHEPMEILRIWHDGWGTGFAVRPYLTEYDEFKYIHIQPTAAVKKGALLQTGTILGVSQKVKIKKWQEHIHFEVWKDKEPINPALMFDDLEMIYDFKKDIWRVEYENKKR